METFTGRLRSELCAGANVASVQQLCREIKKNNDNNNNLQLRFWEDKEQSETLADKTTAHSASSKYCVEFSRDI